MDERIGAQRALRIIGYETPKAVIYKHESHKLHQAFPVRVVSNEPVVIFQGNPVKMMPDGTIDNYYTGDTDGVYIGIAMTDSPTPAYKTNPIEVTVAVQGYLIIRGAAGAALQAGYVEPASTAATAYTVFNQAGTGLDTPTDFIALEAASAANDLVFILCK